MPSYTETFSCDVCCGTTTTTVGPTTTQQPNACPEGYEPCAGESTWSWFVPPNVGQGTTVGPECYWYEIEPCPEGCESYPPDFTPLCEAGQDVSGPGLCCRPITSTTTENPATTTCQPNQVIGYRLQDVFNEFNSTCKICVPALCGSEEPNIFGTCEACRDAANIFNIAQPFCYIYECSPDAPL